jgi:hypothetical protein
VALTAADICSPWVFDDDPIIAEFADPSDEMHDTDPVISINVYPRERQDLPPDA